MTIPLLDLLQYLESALGTDLAIDDSELLQLLGELSLQEVCDDLYRLFVNEVPYHNKRLEVVLSIDTLEELVEPITSVDSIIIESESDESALEVFQIDLQGFANTRVETIAKEVQLTLLDLGY